MWYSSGYNRGLWTGRPVWQGPPGSRFSFPRWVKKGGEVMGRLIRTVGIRKDAVLVVVGWVAFVAGILIPVPVVNVVLLAIARALPKAPY